MQYCYNLESTTDSTKNIFGICMEQVEPYDDGEIITFGGHIYRVYKSVQNFFKQPDFSQFLGNPADAFQMNPLENITLEFTSMIYNGVEQIGAPIIATVGIADYQNFNADMEGFDFYQAPWDGAYLLKNTTMFMSKLNAVMFSLDIPITAVMYTHADGLERFCLLMREGDSFSFVMEKEYMMGVWVYEIGVDVTAEELTWKVDLLDHTVTFDEAEENDYAFRTLDRCPCSRGAHTYALTSCDEESYPSMNVCSLTQLFFLGSIIYFLNDPYKFYSVVYLGENATLCEEYISQDDIGQTNYLNCAEATEARNHLVVNCATGKGTVFAISPSEMTPLNEPCGTCGSGVYNEETGLCEEVLTLPANFNGFKIYGATKGDISVDYGHGGANFYQEITNRPFPIQEVNVSYYGFEDADPTPLVVLNNIQGIWDNTTGSNGRLNITGVKALGGASLQWFGFSKCIELDEDHLFFIGLGADDDCRVKLNGEIIINMGLGANQGSHTHWHVFPIELKAGTNIVEMEYNNLGGLKTFGAEIYDCTQAEIYGWTTLSQLEDALIFSTKDMIGQSMTGSANGYSCPDLYALDYCSGGDIPVCTRIKETAFVTCEYPVIKVEQYPCDCFEVGEETKLEGEAVTVINEFPDCEECRDQIGTCGHSERTIAYSVMVRLPEPEEPDRGFKECCYDNMVLASLSDDKYHKNDFNSFYFKRQLQTDECEFVLIDTETAGEFALNNDVYGAFWDFGDHITQPDLTTYRVDWRKVLQVLGTGKYQIRKDMIIAGIPFPEYSNTFNLEQYTTERADGTVRIDTVMDGKLVHLDVDFKGTGFTTSLRTKGYFGNRNPEYTQDNLVKRNYDTIQISMSQENEYQYQTGLLPICITEELLDFILFGNILYMNDYNASNHSYKYNKFPVELAGNKGTKYFPTIRDSRINLTFTDREKDKRKLNC